MTTTNMRRVADESPWRPYPASHWLFGVLVRLLRWHRFWNADRGEFRSRFAERLTCRAWEHGEWSLARRIVRQMPEVRG